MAKFNSETAAVAGRKSSRAGVSDKCTMQTREAFQKLVENNLPQLQQDLDSLDPKDRVKAIIQLASFILPKLAAVDVTTQGEHLERYVTITSHDWNYIDVEKKTKEQ